MASQSTPEERYAAIRGYGVKDASLFLLDWRWSMVQPVSGNASGTVPLAVALRAIVDLLRTKIIASDTDLVGLIAFGAAQPGRLSESSEVAWPGVRVILPLDRPSAHGIVTLTRLAKRIENGDVRFLRPGQMEKNNPRADPNFSFGIDGPVEMDKALWAVRHQFSVKKATSASAMHTYVRCRTYIITNSDDPTRGLSDNGANTKRLSVRNARDLFEAGVAIDVTFMKCSDDQKFDPNRFYSRIAFVDEDDWAVSHGAIGVTHVAAMHELATLVRRKEVKKRAVSRTTVTLGEGLTFGVALYSLIRRATRPVRVKVRKNDMKRLHLVRDTFCDSTGERLGTNSIRYTFDKLSFTKSNYVHSSGSHGGGDVRVDSSSDNEVGGDGGQKCNEQRARHRPRERVWPDVWSFTTDELRKLTRLGENGLTLFGFRDISALHIEYVMKPSYFVYPDEAYYAGSKKLFGALLESMIKYGKMALMCWNSWSHSSGPRFVYLLPQKETVNEEGMQIEPPGMHLIPLPYKNDIYVAWREELRKLRTDLRQDREHGVQVDEEEQPLGTELAKKLVARIVHKHFSSEHYLNPDMQRFYAGLEWEAGVSEGVFDPGVDTLEPEDDMLKQRTRIKLNESDSYKTDLLSLFKKITLGADFDAGSTASVYGTKTGMQGVENTEKLLKRKREAVQKASEALENLDTERIKDIFDTGNPNVLKADELKTYCRAHRLAVSGTKLVLIERVKNHLARADREVM